MARACLNMFEAYLLKAKLVIPIASEKFHQTIEPGCGVFLITLLVNAIKQMGCFMKSVILGAVAALLLGAGMGVASSASATSYVGVFTSNSGSTDATVDFAATGGLVTSGSGTIFGNAVTLYSNPTPGAASYSPSGYFIYDNTVQQGVNPVITNPGLLFTDAANDEFNIFSNGASPSVPNGTYQLYENNGVNEFGSFAISAVPEPATWAMMILGLVGVGAAFRFARKPDGLNLAV